MNSLLLVRTGVAKTLGKNIFHHGAWLRDAVPKSRSELEEDAKAFFTVLATPPYGVFDAFVQVLGLHAAIEVCNGHTVIRPEHERFVAAPEQMLMGDGGGRNSASSGPSSGRSSSVWV